jgi:hypothetical protein
MTGHECVDPILAFLVYRSRSGSTFFADRLNRHPKVLVIPESNVAPRLLKYFSRIYGKNVEHKKLVEYIYSENKFKEWDLPIEKLLEAFNKQHDLSWEKTFFICCKTYRNWKKPKAKVVVFKKSGWYYKNVDLLLSKFRDVVTIWMLRDPRAVYNSARKALHSEKNRPMAKHILKNALGWEDYVNRLIRAEKKWPDQVYRIKYENLLLDVFHHLNAIWNKLGVGELTDKELNTILDQQNSSHLVTISTKHLHSNVIKKPLFERSEMWKYELPKWKAYLIYLICRKGMHITGYNL